MNSFIILIVILPPIFYLLSFQRKYKIPPGNDISSYIKEVNGKYNTDGIDVNKLTRGSLVFLLNPILYIALWADFNYLFTGKDSFTIPHLKLGNINYMPLIRMGLTRFGLMYHLENYIGHGNKTFLVSIDGGNSPLIKTIGADL